MLYFHVLHAFILIFIPNRKLFSHYAQQPHIPQNKNFDRLKIIGLTRLWLLKRSPPSREWMIRTDGQEAHSNPP